VAKDGRKQRRDTAKGQARRPNLNRYYRKRLRDLRPGSFNFRVDLIRPERTGRDRRVTLDDFVTAITWEDSSEVMTGSLSLIREDPARPLPIGDGHRVTLMVEWGKRWYRLWTMRVDGTPSVSLTTGQTDVALTDQAEALKRNLRDWEFKKDEKVRPKGWKAYEIARKVCRREGVRIGRLAKTTEYLPKIKKDQTDAITIIREAYKAESKKTGRKYVIRFINGKLFVTELKRSRTVYEIDGSAREISLSAEGRNKKPRTVIEAKGRMKVDGKWEKIEATVFRRAILKRYGRSTVEKSYGKLDGMAELREEAKRDLAEEVQVKRSASMTVSGIPFLNRGDTIFWRNKEPGWHGPAKGILNRQYGYLTSVSHSVSPGDYTSDFEVTQIDPYLKDSRKLAEFQREKKDRERKAREDSEDGN